MEYQFPNITPGVYTYGAAPLTGMPSSFTTAPFVHRQPNNEGKSFITNRTTTGFTLVDRGLGPTPIVTITVIEM